MNFQYIKNLINDIKELASSQMIIVILLFAQVSIVTKGLGTIKYGQAVLVLALVAIIFRSLHARNSDVTCLLYTSPSPRDISGSRMPSSA